MARMFLGRQNIVLTLGRIPSGIIESKKHFELICGSFFLCVSLGVEKPIFSKETGIQFCANKR